MDTNCPARNARHGGERIANTSSAMPGAMIRRSASAAVRGPDIAVMIAECARLRPMPLIPKILGFWGVLASVVAMSTVGCTKKDDAGRPAGLPPLENAPAL